jgi:uncharacterized membrane protein YkvA (DUF1232 family)
VTAFGCFPMSCGWSGAWLPTVRSREGSAGGLGLLLGYLLLPIDLVPDFIPVAGYADDVLLVVWVLRSVVRAAGPEALDRHWPGTPHGLEVVRRLAGR